MTDPAPFHADVAGLPEGTPGAPTPQGVQAVWLSTPDGAVLRAAVYRPEGATGTLLLFPGRTEFVEKYGPTMGEFAAAGLATLAIDWRGQGLSDRRAADRQSGHVGDFAEYQEDVAALLDLAAEGDLPRPWHLLAHSMGGAIALRALLNGLDVERVAFSSPMWGISLAPAIRPVAWAMSYLGTRMGYGESHVPGRGRPSYAEALAFEQNLLTSDPDHFAWMEHQAQSYPDLALGGPSLNWLKAALRECRSLSRRRSPGQPALCLLGTDERIIEAEAVETRMARWPGGALRTFEGARHETMMERPEVRGAVFDALKDHFTG